MKCLEIGMYVRYKDEISQIVELDNDTFTKPAFRLDTFAKGMYQGNDLLDNCKKSLNITDLLKIGDYVNGSPVSMIKKDENGRTWIYTDSNYKTGILENDIETVMTKEYFENNCYKIGDK